MSLTKSSVAVNVTAEESSAYSQEIYSEFYWEVSDFTVEKEKNWILLTRVTDFQRLMSIYKFQVFITFSKNSLNHPKIVYDTTKINNKFK